jgi:hypothetical protein
VIYGLNSHENRGKSGGMIVQCKEANVLTRSISDGSLGLTVTVRFAISFTPIAPYPDNGLIWRMGA